MSDFNAFSSSRSSRNSLVSTILPPPYVSAEAMALRITKVSFSKASQLGLTARIGYPVAKMQCCSLGSISRQEAWSLLSGKRSTWSATLTISATASTCLSHHFCPPRTSSRLLPGGTGLAQVSMTSRRRSTSEMGVLSSVSTCSSSHGGAAEVTASVSTIRSDERVRIRSPRTAGRRQEGERAGSLHPRDHDGCCGCPRRCRPGGNGCRAAAGTDRGDLKYAPEQAVTGSPDRPPTKRTAIHRLVSLQVLSKARQGSSPSLSGTSRPVSRILSNGDHPSEARRCRRAPATYPETSREQRSDGFRGQRTGLLGLAPSGVYRAAPVTRCTGGLLHHRFTLTRLLGRAVCSLWHCPAGRPGWALPTTLLCGVRTFLSLVSQAAITRPAHPGDDSTSAGLPEPTPHPGGHTESPGRLATPGLDAGHLTAAGPQSPESAVRTRMRSHSTHRSTSFSGALR